jgi:hypothetical protein
MRIKISIFIASLFFCIYSFAVDFTQIEKDLNGDGLVGWIHGSVENQSMFVFTYRNPDDFFDYVQMSLVSDDDAMLKQLAAYSRHDKVKVKGSFLENPSPQKHIDVSSIELLKKFTSGYPSDSYDHMTNIPEELMSKTRASFVVHAVAEEGQILVLEYKDAIVPVFVRNGALTKDLYRNDVIELSYRVQKYPDQPLHLRINENEDGAVKVLQSMKAIDGKPGSITGALVLFPKSPEISFDVFAVEEILEGGLKRQYTIVNFEDMDLFTKMREKLSAKWNEYPGQYINSRNKLVSTRIRVKASGMFNEVSASQANPQILFKTLDDVQIIEE